MFSLDHPYSSYGRFDQAVRRCNRIERIAAEIARSLLPLGSIKGPSRRSVDAMSSVPSREASGPLGTSARFSSMDVTGWGADRYRHHTPLSSGCKVNKK
jgi:hypothetical protein